MKGLGPDARALIETAARQEQLPSAQSLRRVRRSILHQALAAGTAVATSTSIGAKAGLFGATVAIPVASMVLAGALTGGAMLAFTAPWRDAPSRPVSAGTAQQHAVAPLRPGAVSENALPALAPHEPAGSASVDVSPRPRSAAPPREDEPTTRETTALAAPSPRAAMATRRSDGPQPVTAQPDEAPPPAAIERGSPERASLALELLLLRQARASLRAGRGFDVLTLLDRNRDAFASGALEEEARTARVAALCQLGRETEARLEMADIVRRWPHSPGATRLHQTCSDGALRKP